jgi:hypothetical protein
LVYVGPNKTCFFVHRLIVAKSPTLEAKIFGAVTPETSHDEIYLPHLDEVTAHTLVHYLYTGQYQAFDLVDEAVIDRTRAAYKHATCVYCTALQYGLPELAELAKEKIPSLSKEVAIFDIMSVAREHAFPNLPEAETWYPAHVEDAIKNAVDSDPELFVKPEFVDQVEGDRRFRQVVMKAVVKISSAGLCDRRTGASTPVKESKSEEIRASNPIMSPLPNSNVPGFSVDTLVTGEASGETPERGVMQENVGRNPESLTGHVVPTPEGAALSAEVDNGELKLDEIDPSPQAAVVSQPDKLGVTISEMYQRPAKKGNETHNGSLTSSDDLGHNLGKTNSVMLPLDDSPSKTEDSLMLSLDSSVEKKTGIGDEVTNSPTRSKKSKKKKKGI